MPQKKTKAPRTFKWLGRRTFTRAGIAPGLLETGKEYPVKNVPNAVLKQWIAAGQAQLAQED